MYAPISSTNAIASLHENNKSKTRQTGKCNPIDTQSSVFAFQKKKNVKPIVGVCRINIYNLTVIVKVFRQPFTQTVREKCVCRYKAQHGLLATISHYDNK